MINKWLDIDIPQEVVNIVKLTILDNLGVGLAASKYECSKIMNKFVLENFKGSESFIWSSGKRVSILGACLANAIILDSLDMHDSAHNAKGHAGAAIIPCALAICDEISLFNLKHMEINDFIKMIVIGYETAYRIGEYIVNNSSEYSSSGSWNLFGCCAMACYRFNLSNNEIEQAFGISEYYAPKSEVLGSMENPSMIKDGSGWGSYVGLYSALLAKKGFTSCKSKFFHIKDIWNDIGFEYHLLKYHVFKKYPICYWGQASISAVLKIRNEVIQNLDQIEKIYIKTFPEALTLGKEIPKNSDEVQYNLVYPVIESLIEGNFSINALLIKNLTEEKINLIKKTECMLHSDFKEKKINELQYHANCSQIVVHLRNNKKIDSEMCYVPWDIFKNQDPPTELEINTKFIELCKSVEIDEKKYMKIINIVNNIQEYSINELLTSLENISITYKL